METKYIVTEMADDWYDLHMGKVFGTYEETEKFLIDNGLEDLLGKLEYLESIKDKMVYDGVAELVVSYY